MKNLSNIEDQNIISKPEKSVIFNSLYNNCSEQILPPAKYIKLWSVWGGKFFCFFVIKKDLLPS